MRIWYTGWIIAFLLSGSAQAQVSFVNSNDRLVRSDFHSGVAIGISDVNGDRLDDIIRLSEGMVLNVEYQVPGSAKFVSREYGSMGNSSQWALVVGDLDNDGQNDVLTGDSGSRIRYARSGGDGFTYDIETIVGSNLFCQGMNLADINMDGYLDLFVCNDVEESWIFANDGSGNLIEANDLIDMTTVPASDNSGNYASIWTDFDNDRDLDLYISKCRQGVTDPTDPRRINALFLNDGSGNYVEAADSFGLASGDQSWATDFGDIDNDGDLDAIIINHDAPTQLLENDGQGNFTDITDGSNIWVNGQPLQISFRDFDNDGFLDVIAAGTVHKLFINNGDKTFTNITNDVFDENQIESYGLGDLNNDGFLDIYAGYARIFTQPSNTDDVIWLNEGNDNNWVEFSLEAASGQVNAVGARLELFGPWGVQLREVRSGEGYGIHNSFMQHFGMGDVATADSLRIIWPSGQVDVHTNVTANAFYVAYEGDCISQLRMNELSADPILCSGESLDIQAPEGYEYQWSTGDTNRTLTVDSSGLYVARLFDPATGCVEYTESVHVIVDPDETPDIQIDGEPIFCLGSSVLLATSQTSDITWSEGSTTPQINATETGDYFVTYEGICRPFNSDTIAIWAVESEIPLLVTDTLTEPGQAVLQGVGDSIYWYDVPDGGTPIDSGQFFITEQLDETTTFFVENHTVVPGEVQFGGKEDISGGGGQNSPNFTGGLRFNVFEEFILVSVLVESFANEIRTFQLYNDNGDLVHESDIQIDTGMQKVMLNWRIQPGSGYEFTADGNPKLFRNNMNVNFPYALGNWGEITESLFGPFFYYFFYDWEMKKDDIRCISDRIPVVVLYDETLSTTLPDADRTFLLFPNPVSGVLSLRFDQNLAEIQDIRILNTSGQRVLTQTDSTIGKDGIDLNVSQLANGLYLIEVQTENGTIVNRFVKIK